MDELLTYEHFVPQVSKRFSFEGQPQTLLLRSADTHPNFAVPGASRIPFALIFEGPPADILPAGHDRATGQDGPIFELYVMPIHTHVRDRQDYQAVFN
jgi:hypothetical protein